MSSPLTRLWTHVTSALSRLRASIPPLNTLLANERRSLHASLRALEAYCRRLAITEALTGHARTAPDACPLPAAHGPAATPPKQRKRRPFLRLWPRPARSPVRITMLGPPTSLREIWRAQQRAILVARLKRARAKRKPLHIRLADRIDALQRFIDAPRAAVRRLARKLRRTPKLGFVIAARRAPASPYLSPAETADCERLCWAALTDSS